MLRRSGFIAVLLTALAIIGCSKDTPVEPPPGGHDVVYPLHQETPDWSRQGELAYVDNGIVCVEANGTYAVDPGRRGIWIWNPATDLRSRLVPFGNAPAWSPDGRQVAFSTDYVGQIFVVDADGTNARDITGPAGFFFPRWSPDGSRLCWCRPAGDSSGVWIANADGSHRQFVAPFAGGADWRTDAPDTLVYAIAEPPPNTLGLFAQSVSSGGRRRLYSGTTTNAVHPRCSPLDASVAFELRATTARLASIWVLAPGAAAPRRVTPDGAVTPSWTADGGGLAFARYDWQTNAGDWNVVWNVTISNGRAVQLTTHWPEICQAVLAKPAFYYRPSPDRPADPSRREAALTSSQ